MGEKTLNGEVIRSLATTKDGIWAGTSRRLLELNHNGSLIRSWVAGNQIPYSGVRTLLADPLGGVWAGFESGQLMRLVEDRIEIFGEADGLPPQALLALARGP